jgi:hypothetical protein
VVVGEDRGLHLRGGAAGAEVGSSRGDGIAGIVDVHDAVVVAVDPVSAGALGGGVDRGAAPGVPGGSAGAELRGSGGPGEVRAGMHAGRAGAAARSAAVP